MNKKILWIALTLSLAVNVSGLATIGYHYWSSTCLTPSTPCPLNPTDRHPYQDLGLSSEQMTQMASIAQLFHSRLNELEGSVETKRDLLIDALGKEKIDLPRTEAIRKEIAVFQDEIQKEVIAHIAESKKIMTPDQQKRFIELLRVSSTNGQLKSRFPINGGKQ